MPWNRWKRRPRVRPLDDALGRGEEAVAVRRLPLRVGGMGVTVDREDVGAGGRGSGGEKTRLFQGCWE